MVCKNRDFHNKKSRKTLKKRDKKNVQVGGLPAILRGIGEAALSPVMGAVDTFAPKSISDAAHHAECTALHASLKTYAEVAAVAALNVVPGVGEAADAALLASEGAEVAEVGATAAEAVEAGSAAAETAEAGTAAAETAEGAAETGKSVESGVDKVNESHKKVKDANNKLKEHHNKVKEKGCGASKDVDRMTDSMDGFPGKLDEETLEKNVEYHHKKFEKHHSERKEHMEKLQLEQMKEQQENIKPPSNPDYLFFLIMYLLNQYKEHSLEHDLKVREEKQADHKKALAKAKERNIVNTKTLRRARDMTKKLERKTRARKKASEKK